MEENQTHLIHSFPKGNNEQVQIAVRKYNGNYYIDLRTWYQGKNDKTFHPTKKGIFFSFDQLLELRKGVSELLKVADKFKKTDPLEV